MSAKFELGRIVITAAAADVLDNRDVEASLVRHRGGDFGELCDEDRRQNENALVQGLRIFSIYQDRGRRKFYIITEHDRSVTTVLLPEDY